MRRFLHLFVLLITVLTPAGCDRGNRPAGAAAAQERDADVRNRVEQQLGDIPVGTADTTSAARLSATFRAAAAQALPAVVRITTIAVVDGPSLSFPQAETGTQRTQGTGSGFVIDASGYILTNHHVVQNAMTVQVALLDGREFTADVVGTDPSTDVAVIRVDARNETLPAIALGDSEQLRVGDWVIALGNPLGLTFTATAGIVSAKGRAIGILGQGDPSSALESFIQTDAAINPGNSGGPLVDLTGRVVGINTAIESQTGFFTGAGFAIPIALARKVANDLIQHGVVHRPRLGISIQDVTAADAEVYGLSTIRGVEVTSVTPGEAAHRAGLQLGDVITTIDGAAVNTLTELQSRVALFQPGDRIQVGFLRQNKPLQAVVQLGQFAAAQVDMQQRERPQRNANPLGFTVTVLPVSIARRLRLQGDEIPVVTEVDELSPAASSGLSRGHIIRRFNNREIRSIRDLERAAATVRPGDVVSLIYLNARQAEPVPTIANYRIQ
jgi:serine protease Do